MTFLRFLDLEDQFLTLNLMRETSTRKSSPIWKDSLGGRKPLKRPSGKPVSRVPTSVTEPPDRGVPAAPVTLVETFVKFFISMGWEL
jgi:hypothetical protein